ncbi:MAG: nucleotidyltransferase domain-containing protein [Lachnospiraceae bacterium]|nr:nucleotidyltransferase domain-containing protein [Lachnospiraceae bacterium]
MNILVKAIAGSHLFGTNTPESGTDYKGVYLPSRKDILLNRVVPSISIKTNESGNKNTKEDVDVEYYSLQKFMQMLFEGQTVALELLWTPEDMIIECHPAWRALQKNRNKLLHKKVTAFVHYCKTQADKYGVKGSRMAAVKKAIDTIEELKEFHVGTTKLIYLWDRLQGQLANTEHIEFGGQELPGGKVFHIEICNRKYQEHASLDYTLNSLKKLYESYGHRAKAAENNNGIDWKALSHAYRVCCQAIDILKNKTLSLPLKPKDLELVRNVKLGTIPFETFRPILEAKLEEVLKAQAESTLPENFDYKFWCEDYVMEVYSDIVNS